MSAENHTRDASLLESYFFDWLLLDFYSSFHIFLLAKWEMRLKSTIYESTLSTAARSPFPNGEGLRYENTAIPETKPSPRGEGKEEAALPPKKEANPASLCSAPPSKGRGSRGRSLLPMEGGAPKGRRLDGGSGMKKIGENRLKYAVCESILSTAARSPFPNGEGCETRIPLSPFCRIF